MDTTWDAEAIYPLHPEALPRPALTAEGWAPLLLPVLLILAIAVGTDSLRDEPAHQKKETPPMSATITNDDLGAETRVLVDRIEHVHLKTRDIDRSIDFYRRVFGWEVRYDGIGAYGRCVHLGTDRFYVALTGVDGFGIDGFYHVGLTTPDLSAFRERLLAEGVEIVQEADREEGAAVYFNDPDGYEYEVVEYREGYVYR